MEDKKLLRIISFLFLLTGIFFSYTLLKNNPSKIVYKQNRAYEVNRITKEEILSYSADTREIIYIFQTKNTIWNDGVNWSNVSFNIELINNLASVDIGKAELENLNRIKINKLEEDKVHYLLSAKETKQNNDFIGNKENSVLNPEDDLVIFDYSDTEEKTSLKNLNRRPYTSYLKKGTKVSSIKNNSTTGIKYRDYKKIAFSNTHKKNHNNYKNALIMSSHKSSDTEYSKFNYNFHIAPIGSLKISVDGLTLNEEGDGYVLSSLKSFDFATNYDVNNVIEADHNGVIEFSSDYRVGNFIGGLITKQNFVRTRINFLLKDKSINVVLLERDFLNKILDNEGLNGIGSYVLVKVNNSILDVDIDKEYEKRIFLNNDLEVIEQPEESLGYILFVGVIPGNIIIEYLLEHKAIAKNIVSVFDDELFYDNSILETEKIDNLILWQSNVMGIKPMELDVSPKNISYFTGVNPAEKEGLNYYQIKIPVRSETFRKYLMLSHLSYPIFVGYNKINKLFIPSSNFIKNIVNNFGYSDIDSRCIIQINLNERPIDIYINGRSIMGTMDYDIMYLDNDGVFSSSISSISKNIFISGDSEGLFGIKIDYKDSSDFIQPVCSLSSYIVEQL